MALQAAINDPKLKQQLSGVISMLKNKVYCVMLSRWVVAWRKDASWRQSWGHRDGHRGVQGVHPSDFSLSYHTMRLLVSSQTGLSAMEPPAKPASTPDPARQAAIAKQLGPEKYVRWFAFIPP